MALLSILEYPDTRLRTRAQPVTEFDQPLSQLVDDMFETMYAANGIGLAATQVNVHRRVIVTDVSGNGAEPLLYINPTILTAEGIDKTEEGCLSVPGIYDEVARAARVRVRAQDRRGEFFETELNDLHAVCLQHEIDHIDGKLFVDYLSELKRQRIRRRLEKDRKDRLAERGSPSSGSVRAY